ncbi:ABC transporter ATP-binding protein [uncultured Tateyamaria sp.]|uniref:ABC transporter ATP-binding protein n=1 Tax=uncultured Tateyamaria sp. TaxID=455651 RepID=UPI002617E306|nr:ABC transporter ATP-binding protein [uncultured Tateyamaria sp.]
MIQLENLTKTFVLEGQRKTVADNLSVVFPTGRSVALLGRNGAGKSTLLKIISGNMDATSGRVLSTGTISWPVGFAGAFHGDLSGAQNARFIARIYGVDTNDMVDFVADFAKLGTQFHLPVRSYSSGMRARLAFGISMAVAFDTYLVDEVTAVGDADFRRRSSEVFQARMDKASAIVVTHSMPLVRQLCDAGAVLENGQLTYYDDLDQAIEHHEQNLA